MQRVGREGRRVVPVELAQGAHEVIGARVARRELVGLEFLPAGKEARERLEREREGRNHHHERRQERPGGQREGETERPGEGGLAARPAQDGEQPEREREAHREEPRDVAAREVPQLVGEDGLDLALREALDERVEEHDALGATEAREVGVAVARALRAVHHEEALGAETAARHERFDA